MPDQRTTASRSDSDGTDSTTADSHRRDGRGSASHDADGAGADSEAPDGHPDGHDVDADTDPPATRSGTDASDTDTGDTEADTDDTEADTGDAEDDTDDAEDDANSADSVGTDDAEATDAEPDTDDADTPDSGRFRKLDGVEYDRVNDFLDGYVDFTAREWAVARLCADFRTGTGVPMTTVGEHLPEMVPFVTEPYTRQEVYGARRSFAERVRRAAATFLYGAASGLLAAEEVDDVLYEATEVARFLLEVEGTALSLDDERAVEERTVAAMRSVHEASLAVRYDECPDCGASLGEDAT